MRRGVRMVRDHSAWIVAGVGFTALLAAALAAVGVWLYLR